MLDHIAVQIERGGTDMRNASLGLLLLFACTASFGQLNVVQAPANSNDKNWNDFVTYVLPSSLVNGVNPWVSWNSIETSQGTYNFTALDQWVTSVAGYGKKTNPIFWAVSNGNVNTSTPSYVFTSSWASSTGYNHALDVVSCQAYPGGVPVVYETPFKVAYKNFMAAVIAHYAGNPNIGYMRFGLSEGGEVYPWCQPQLPGFTPQVWISYIQEMEAYQQSLYPTMPLGQSIDPVRNDPAFVVPGAEEAMAVQNGFGIGFNGLWGSEYPTLQSGTSLYRELVCSAPGSRWIGKNDRTAELVSK